MVREALKAAETLEEEGIDAEVIDLRTLKPLDTELLFTSVRKTGRVVIADGSWKTCGVAGEITALIAENLLSFLKLPPQRVTLPDLPAASRSWKAYFPTRKHRPSSASGVLKAEAQEELKAKEEKDDPDEC
jgi:pyruvate/2-oxoglutarate/acetoin dehydrogenase E1 component